MLYNLPEDLQELVWKHFFKLSLNCIVDQHIFQTEYDDDMIFITEELKKDILFAKRVRNYMKKVLSLYSDKLEHISQLDRYRCHIISSFTQTMEESVYRISN